MQTFVRAPALLAVAAATVSAAKCPAGFYIKSGRCTVCAAGKWQPTANSATTRCC